MKPLAKILLAAVLAIGAGYVAAKPVLKVKTNFAYNSEDRHLSGFSSIDVAGSFDVYIVQGATESVKVEAPADDMNRIVTEVTSGMLKIYNKHSNMGWGNWWNGKKVAIYVSVKDINAIQITGSGDVYFKEGLHANSLKLMVTGSGDVVGKVDVKTLDCNITGSGDMTLGGRAETANAVVTGSGDLNAKGVAIATASVHVSGSGDADVNVSQKLNASVSGSGDVRYTGAVKDVSSHKSGSGDIERM